MPYFEHLTLNIYKTYTQEMARTTKFQLKLNFECDIRGLHAFKRFWDPVLEENLKCQPDSSPKATDKDPNAIGVWKENIVVGHIPKQISELVRHFLELEGAKLDSSPIGKRKFDFLNGLVVPARYTARLPKAKNGI